MPDSKPPQRRHNIQVVIAVLSVVGLLAGFARLPSPSPAERARLASHFQFSWKKLPPAPHPRGGVVFPANKTAVHMQFYLYQVGASAALGDLDGDGLPN